MSSSIRYSNSTSCIDFLNGLVEASVEMSSDGSNGDCIVHYGGQYSMFKMLVKLVNGKRDGLATLMKNDVPCMKFEYRDGVLTDRVEIVNEEGIIDLTERLSDIGGIGEMTAEPLSIEMCESESSIHDFLVSIMKQAEVSLVVCDIETGNEYGVILFNEKCYAMKWRRRSLLLRQM